MANTESHKLLSSILNSVGDAVIAADREGLITFMNPVAEILTGWEMEEATGKQVTDILDICVGNAGNLKKSTILIEALQKGSVSAGELSSASQADYSTWLVAKSGGEISIDYNITPITDEKGDLTGIVMTIRDVTKYKTKEEGSNQTISELHHQIQLMKTVFDSMYDGIVVLSLTGTILLLNPSIQQMIGKEPPDTFLNKWPETYGVFYPDKETLVPVDQFLATYISQGEAVRDLELFVRNKEQTERIYIKASGIPLFDENQEVVACVCIIRDITGDKIAAIQLEETMQKLQNQVQLTRTILDSVTDAIGMFNDDGYLLYANQHYQQLFDLTEDQLRQMSPDALKARMKARFQKPELSPPGEGAFSENLENVVEEIGETSQPEPKLFYHLITPVWNNQGDSAGNVISYRDMSKEVEIQKIKAEVHRLRAELETRHSFDDIVGKSQNMQQIFALMQRAAESDINVLISGESGTGKELVARAIHFNSPRKAAPFVTVNCAAIPETLIESELFGHERGAFTGATTKRIGKFEHAHQGTIFFDEIGDMQLVLQAKLLRAIQERRIQRVGGTTNIPIDIRVLTATNQNLEPAMEAGAFREDLYYRIAVFPITVPPLRDRREDIPLLANHFLKKYAEKVTKSIKAISANALQLLMQYDFPGNVRELENMIERAVLLETTELLQPTSLPSQISSVISTQPILFTPDPTGIVPLEEVERQTLAHALKVMDNDVTKAAQALKIHRSTLYRKVKLYQLAVSD